MAFKEKISGLFAKLKNKIDTLPRIKIVVEDAPKVAEPVSEETEKKEETIPEGLTSEQAAALAKEGKANVSKEKHGKSYLGIIRDNLFTYFNLVWAIVAVVLVSVDSFDNLTFLAVVIPNLLVAIIQESRAKAAVEKLSVTTEPKATVVRDGTLTDVASCDVVLGDVMRVELGRQILSDSVVISGVCEVNESMLTGESVPVKKQVGDRLLAGSFLVSGSVYAKVDRVGKDNYLHTIEKEAKSFKKPVSNLFRDLGNLIKGIGIFLIPMSTVLAVINWLSYRASYSGAELVKQIVTKTAGSIIGMIPAGIYLLVTLTLSLSVVTLARKKTLVQDMYSIEMLASADVVCLDKTGTITDGTMQVSCVESLDGTDSGEIARVMSYVEGVDNGINATSRALIHSFGRSVGNVTESVPFSSERKYFAANIEEVGIYAVGAPHFVPCEVSKELDEKISSHASLGERVLLLVRLQDINKPGEPVALIAIEDRIRPNAAETIAKFQEQGVTMKVISGDHAQTVSAIACKVGIINGDRYISCENLTDEELSEVAEEYAVFGRVTPEQKVLLVKILQKNGHTVAMTGDGVNDTLALKEANCAIAMADGSEMARKISQIVLMNSDFGTLPDVVKEGRRCINNVRQSAVLYLMKTVFTILVSIFAIVTAQGYPFEPKHFIFLELFVIGIASVLLALEPNNKRIEGSFLDTVLIKSSPCALALFIPVAVVLIVSWAAGSGSIPDVCRNAVAMCVVTLVGFTNLIFICRPYTKWRAAVVTLVGILLGVAVTLSIFLDKFLSAQQVFGFLHVMDNPVFFGVVLILGVSCCILLNLFRAQLESWVRKMKKPSGRKGARGAK